ncbi:16648_t:CDS:2 [Entrophospora sp. SA101]|nr:12346_t:CDS:2 [Entrophospora sp. SA101]CAJ0927734.1 16648_t:CDS:2 [Entrophospora sp. SA101]
MASLNANKKTENDYALSNSFKHESSSNEDEETIKKPENEEIRIITKTTNAPESAVNFILRSASLWQCCVPVFRSMMGSLLDVVKHGVIRFQFDSSKFLLK